eukprot:2999132-Lingulodinium_polyedra.AAC.1
MIGREERREAGASRASSVARPAPPWSAATTPARRVWRASSRQTRRCPRAVARAGSRTWRATLATRSG